MLVILVYPIHVFLFFHYKQIFLKFHIKYFRHSHHWSSLCSVPLFTAHQDFGHSTRPFWRNRAFRGNGPTRRRVTTPVRVRKSRKHSTTQDKINKSYFSFQTLFPCCRKWVTLLQGQLFLWCNKFTDLWLILTLPLETRSSSNIM